MRQGRTTVKRLVRGLFEPEVVYLLLRNWAKMARKGRLKPLYGSVFETVVTPGSNPYLETLTEQNEDGRVLRDVLDFQMYLDVSDAGLSRTLLQYGIREEASTNAFRAELKRLKEQTTGDVRVLEVGANIGYYTLLEATVLGERGTIHAVEPVPKNVELLTENLKLNGVAERVSVHQLALGPRTERAQLHLSEESNWHSVNRISDHRDAMDVDMLTVEDFLATQDVSPDEINVLRADLEGFEVELFEEMDEVLEAGTPLLVFLELHPSFRDGRELNRVVDALSNHGFTIASTAVDVYGNRFDQGWHAKPISFESFEELKEHNRTSDAAVELIAKREPQ